MPHFMGGDRFANFSISNLELYFLTVISWVRM
jgi:hypothetical protein